MKRTLSVVILCFVIICSGCTSRPQIRELSESSVVVAFGNSLTSGAGANQTESYPSVLSSLIKCQVINEGIPGETSSSGLKRLPIVLEKTKPDLVIICHGGNDILQRQNLNLTAKNISDMISMIKNSGADAILIGVPKPGLRMRPPSFYKEIANKHSIPYDLKSLSTLLSSPKLKSDQIHLNAAGYKKLAESLAELINKTQN